MEKVSQKTKIMGWVQKYTMIIILILVVAFFASQKDGAILSSQNITNLIAQNAYVFILSVGMLLCILTGGNIDLSVGSVVCFVGGVGAVFMSNGMNMWLAVILMLAIGTAIGAWQAYWIAYVRVPPFITTLAGMLVFRGLSNVVLGGKTMSIASQDLYIQIFGGGANCYIGGSEFRNTLALIVGAIAIVVYLFCVIRGRMTRVSKGYEVDSMVKTIIQTVVIVGVIAFFSYKLSGYKGLPTALLWVGVVVLIYGYITSKTTIGRHFYAVGGNEKATRMSGINTNRVYFIAYTNMGLLSALAGIMTIARMMSAQPTYGDGYEMDAIGSCFIGGASAYGGVGTVTGVIIGAVLMGVINLGMSIMGVDQNLQKVVKGAVLLAAVIFDVVSKKQKS